jgi:hypothetical protein
MGESWRYRASVLVSNRGHNSVTMFEIEPDSGELEVIGWESTRGQWPRGMNIDPSGNFLYAANQNTDIEVETAAPVGPEDVFDVRNVMTCTSCLHTSQSRTATRGLGEATTLRNRGERGHVDHRPGTTGRQRRPSRARIRHGYAIAQRWPEARRAIIPSLGRLLTEMGSDGESGSHMTRRWREQGFEPSVPLENESVSLA